MVIRKGSGASPSDGFWRDRSVLVTGAGGFVASRLSSRLVDAEASVVGIMRDSAGSRLLRQLGIHDALTIVRGSITQFELIERVLNEYEVDTVFHLAAQALVGAANRSPLSTFESNIRGTWHVLEAARRSQTVTRVVIASSDKAYGHQTELPYRESTPLAGEYPYDASKVCADVLARSYFATYDLPVVVTRFANIYGGGDLNWSRLIPGTVRSGLRGDPVIIRSDGTMERDYVYIQDALAGYLRAAESASDEDVRGRAFNFGSGSATSVLDVARMILELMDSDSEFEILGEAKGEIDRQYLDSALAKRLLDWVPAVPFSKGLTETIHWYSNYLDIPVQATRLATAGG